MTEQLEFVKEIARRLDSKGIPYMVTGSIALALYAQPRMTRDIDLVVECGPGDMDLIVGLFEDDCYVSEEEVREAMLNRGMFNVIHTQWSVKADFIIRKNDAFREVELGRRRQIDIEGTEVSVVSPEDLLLSKLHWSKDSQSEIQLEDTRALVRTVPDLDWDYLERWAIHLGVQSQLAELKEP